MSNSNSNSNGEVKITRKRYYNLMNKGMDALLKNLYLPTNRHPRNRLTYQNIMQMKRAIQARRRPNNAKNPMTPGNRNFTSNGHQISIFEYGINGSPNGHISWNILKTRPNGRLIEYSTMALNNNKPVNLKKLDVIFWKASYPGRPRNEAALTIQRKWRARKEKGPFSNQVIKTILKTHIMPKLPKKNKVSVAAAFRNPTSLNRSMVERSRRVDPFWRAILGNVTRRSILKGKTGMLTRKEFEKLGPHGTAKVKWNPATRRNEVMAPESVWQNVRTMRRLTPTRQGPKHRKA